MKLVKSVIYAVASAGAVMSSGALPNARADDASAGPIEKVTVTARRHEENLQGLPASATVVSGNRLNEDGVTNSIDLGELATSLNVEGTLGQRDNNIFTIRGQTQPFGGADPGVQTYFSEVPFNAGGPGTYFDLHDVQILNGPQGTLFGRNTTGGALLFDPNRPTNDLSGALRLTGGSRNDQEAEGFANIPIISDKLMVRVAGAAQSRDGFTDDLSFGRKLDDEAHAAFRVGATWKPFEGFENYLLYDNYRSDNNGTSSILTAVAPGSAADIFFGPGFLPPGFTIQDFLAFQQAVGPRKATLDTFLFNHTQIWGVTDIASYAINDNLKIRNIFGYRIDREQPAFDFDGSPFPAIDIPNTRAWETNSRQTTEEVQLQGHTFGRLDWIIGYYYESDQPDGYSETQRITLSPLGPTTLFQTTNLSGTSQAAFVQGTYDLSDWVKGLSFTAGGRHTWDHKASDSITCIFVNPGDCPAPLPAGFTQSADFKAPTWTLALSYQADPDTLLYVTSRHGYKSGGFNAGAPPAFAEFQPEYITDVEIGAKRDWTIFGIPARTNIDAYRGDYSNIQKNDFGCLDGFGNVNSSGSALACFGSGGQVVVLTVNGAQAIVQGIDFDSTFVPVPGLQLRFAYSFTDTSYGKFVTFSGDHKGDPFAYAPRNKFSITGRYHLPLDGWLGEPIVVANYAYQSKIWFSDFADLEPDSWQKGYGVLNLRGEIHRLFGSLSATRIELTSPAGSRAPCRRQCVRRTPGIRQARSSAPVDGCI